MVRWDYGVGTGVENTEVWIVTRVTEKANI